jgi:two-component system sensor histidine kinase AlgZ
LKPAAPRTRPSVAPPSSFGGASAYPSFADTMQAAARLQGGPVGGAFDVCHAGLALRAVLFVQVVLGVGCLLAASSWAHALSLLGPVVFAGLFATLGWLVGVCALRKVLNRSSTASRAVFVLGWGALCAIVGRAMLLPFDLSEMPTVRWLGVAGAGALLAASLWAWLVLRVRSRLPAEATARLAELQSRIRPHFLFNTLNTAVALVRVDPAQAENVLEDLAQLFRVALEDHGQAVTLAEELDLVQRYLAIEQLRFGDRLNLRWEVDEAANAAQLPPLLLQPLVENAVRHGIEPSPEGGEIRVRTQVRRGQAVITIVNTLPKVPSTPGHGIALKNVRSRLRLLHDVAAQMVAGPDGERYRVQIEVPL